MQLYKRLTTLAVALLILSSQSLFAQEALPQYGVESRSSEFFSERYLYNDLVHYLDNLDLYVTYQSETTGAFNQPDRLLFSVEGNSYRWNSYYLDGFRIDSRYFSGSTPYSPDLYNSSLKLDYIGSNLYFEQQRNSADFISASYNVGGVGGISPGTEAAIHLFHPTATDRAYKPFEYRNKVNGAGSFIALFN